MALAAAAATVTPSGVHDENTNELVNVACTWTVGGAPTDPTTISLTITTPSGTATTYTFAASQITKASTGAYNKDLACTEDGVWLFLWEGTGTAQAAAAGTWTVSDTNQQRLYCTPEELKSRVGINDNLDDAQILAACTAVSKWIDKKCDRHFYRRTATLTVEPSGQYCIDVPDLVSVTTLKTDSNGDGTFDVTWSASDYQLLPANAATEAEPEPYTEIKAVGSYLFPLTCWTPSTVRKNRVEIAGVWGWPAVPEDVKQAAAILSADFLKLGGMAFGVAGYGEYGPVRARPNPIVLELIGPYRRNPILVA